MFEIIPNWHPLFVHFTVSSLSLASVFYVLAFIFKNKASYEKVKTFADWSLWIGSGFAVVTAIAGWFAYNSVAHDTPSHVAMTDHRNWALATLALFLVLAVWAYVRNRSAKTVNVGFIFVVLIAFALLGSTAWRGGEVVYRYGLGVMSLPVVEAGNDGHDHEHAGDTGHASEARESLDDMTPMNENMLPEKRSHHNDSNTHGSHQH